MSGIDENPGEFGRKGGRNGKGKAKARTPEQCRAAALCRVEKRRKREEAAARRKGRAFVKAFLKRAREAQR